MPGSSASRRRRGAWPNGWKPIRRSSEVNYPGLKSHPGHEIAARQQKGFGAMLSFELADIDGGADPGRSTGGLHPGGVAGGGVESLIAHPTLMTHAAMTPEARETAGITDGLLRLSIGLEHPEDLLADLSTALDAVVAATSLEAEAA